MSRTLKQLLSLLFKSYRNRHMNREVLVLLQFALLQGHHALLDAQAALVLFHRRRNRMTRSCWVRPWLSAERRLQYGHYDRLLAELRIEDQQSFFNFMRMAPEMWSARHFLIAISSCFATYLTLNTRLINMFTVRTCWKRSSRVV